MMEHDLTLRPRQRHNCKCGSGKFCSIQELLSGKRLEDQNALQKRVVQYFTSLEKKHYHEEMFKFVKQYDKYLSSVGDYVEK
jgi:hypothetical protein